MICVILFGIACLAFVGYLLYVICDDMDKSDEFWEYLNDEHKHPWAGFKYWKEKKREKQKRAK